MTGAIQNNILSPFQRLIPVCAGMMAGLFCFRAEAAEHAAADTAHGSGGLPQFDPTSFSSQVFWLLIAFAFLYVFFSRKTLPAISSVIGNRQEQISSDRELAEQLKNESEGVLRAYEKGLESARAESAKMNADSVELSKKAAEKALADFQQKAENQMKILETRLNESRFQIMDEMNTIAAEIAAEAAEKIVGISTDIHQAKTVVQSLNFKMSKAA